MADAVYSPYVNVTLAARECLGTGKLDGEWLRDNELWPHILRRVISTPQTYKLERISAGSAIATPRTYATFIWRGQPTIHTYLMDMLFAGQADCVYGVYSSGSIIVLGGAETRASIDVTATPVEFNLVMVDLLTWMLATDKCQQIAQSAGGGSYSPAQVYDQILAMAAIWQGVQCA